MKLEITEKQRRNLIDLINKALFSTSDILEGFNRLELDSILFELSILSTKYCIVKECPNTQEKFTGDLCIPCYKMLVTGIIPSNGETFIHRLKRINTRILGT